MIITDFEITSNVSHSLCLYIDTNEKKIKKAIGEAFSEILPNIHKGETLYLNYKKCSFSFLVTDIVYYGHYKCTGLLKDKVIPDTVRKVLFLKVEEALSI